MILVDVYFEVVANENVKVNHGLGVNAAKLVIAETPALYDMTHIDPD
jgi:hypothetical protein